MRTTLAIALATMLVLAACGGASYSDRADDYIPETVDDVEVTTGDAFALSIAESVAAGGVDSSASGVVPGDGPVPEVVMLAVAGDETALRDTREQLLGSLAIGADTEPDADEIGGVEVETYSGDAQDRDVSVAVASPREDVVLIALGFANGAENSRAAMDAMLATGSG